jgi:hypothetical protein
MASIISFFSSYSVINGVFSFKSVKSPREGSRGILKTLYLSLSIRLKVRVEPRCKSLKILTVPLGP